MRTYSFSSKYGTLISGAVIAAFISRRGKSFRQSEVRFFFELFSNWTEYSLDFSNLTIQNVQVSRHLKELENAGYLRSLRGGRKPEHILTRPGLLYILSTMVTQRQIRPTSIFFFTYYFIERYGQILRALIKEGDRPFPVAFETELDTLLDLNKLKEAELVLIDLEIKRLDARTKDALQIAKLFKEMMDKGKAWEEIVHAVEKLYSYDLNSKRPLHELLEDVPREIAQWEIEIGPKKRAQQIWIQRRRVLENSAMLIRQLE